MDQDLGWWAEVVFGGWHDRTGPRYQRLAAALLDAVSRRVLEAGVQVPAERTLARAVGVSRGTVVACFDELVAAGVLRRRVGSGTFVVGRPSWAAPGPAPGGVAELLLRRMADSDLMIDLSVSSPSDLRHLPAVDVGAAWGGLDGNGLDPRGLAGLRAAVARHLSSHQRLPTSPEQVVITGGAQEALWLVGRVLRPSMVLVSCPTYPGVPGAFGRGNVAVVAGDAAGTDANAVARAGAGAGAGSGAGSASGAGGSVAVVMPTGHNPTGLVMSGVRRQAFAAIADAGRVTIVEDMTLADLCLEAGLAGLSRAAASSAALPLAALSAEVIAVGSVSKLLWGGLRVGWIRIGSARLREALLARKAALNLATSGLAQAVVAALLDAVTDDWLRAHRAALVRRRDHLSSLIGSALPAWQVSRPAAGLSLWVRLPVADAATFAHVASRHGVGVAAGGAACLDGQHRGYIRLSFAEQPDTLSLAVERLAVAWEAHSENLAAGVVG
jgi:DNA-binding transcriptional MocR family regulator